MASPSSAAKDTYRQKAVRRIKRDIFVVLSFKVTIILLAAFFVFGAAQRVHVDPTVMFNQLTR